ncbi:MAG: twin-arginine translocase subunit TatB [Rhodobacteraceae bacterium]|nr:twin-arginine translocase subunit TatB [Paracoccaceae bacterium]
MPDIGLMELLVIGVVALIVAGPKDLPRMFRTFGQVTGRIRGMAREFSRAMEDAAEDTGLRDLGKDMRDLTNPGKMGMDALNRTFDDIDPTKFEKGSETRALAEKRAAQSEAAKAKAAGMCATREEKIRQDGITALSESATPPAISPRAATHIPREPMATRPATEARTGPDKA